MVRRARPGDRNTGPLNVAEPFAPPRDALLVHLKVGNRTRNGRWLGPQHAWQAPERTMGIERGKRLAADQNLLNAFDALEQGGKFLRSLEQHSRPEPGKDRGIAHELNAVAQPLFGVQK